MEITFKNKTIFVTGGTGFVGSHLVEKLVALGANVVTTYQSINKQSYFFSKELDKKTTMLHIDTCDFEKIFAAVTKYHIDYIFHLAAQALVETAYNNPKDTLYQNILGTINVVEAARLYPHIKGVIIASSDKAYGKLTKEKYKETDPLRGDHPYEVSKSSADLIALSYFTTYNVPIVTTRFGNIYGEGDLHFSRIIPGILQSIITKEPLQLRSNGKHVRDYLYVKDVVNGYLLLAANIEKTKGQAFNFGSKETLSVFDVIDIAQKSLHKKISYNIINTATNEIPYQSLDYSKIKILLKWKSQYTIASVLPTIFTWYKNWLNEMPIYNQL